MIERIYILHDPSGDAVAEMILPSGDTPNDGLFSLLLDEDRSTKGSAQRVDVAGDELIFHRVDVPLSVYVNRMSGAPLTIDRPGRLFVCPDDGRVRADFLGGAAPAAEAEPTAVYHGRPYAVGGVAVSAHTFRGLGATDDADTSGEVMASIGAGGQYHTGYSPAYRANAFIAYVDPATAGHSYGWHLWPSLPLEMLNERNALHAVTHEGLDGEVWGFELDAAAKLSAPATPEGRGKTRAMIGVGAPQTGGGVTQFVGAGFYVDPQEGDEWRATLSPYNRLTVGDDPYYFRVPTGVPFEASRVHLFSVLLGFFEGLPRVQWLIDGNVVADYTGYLDPADGAGDPASRDGTFGLSRTWSVGYGAACLNGDAVSRAQIAAGMVHGLRIIRGARFV